MKKLWRRTLPRCVVAMILVAVFMLPCIPVYSYAESARSVTAKLDELCSIMDGKYWNAGKDPSSLIRAVDAGDLTDSGLGLTYGKCPGTRKATGCTSNTFYYGGESSATQCNGFSKFLAYYLFRQDGDLKNWPDNVGESVRNLTFTPGDRIGYFKNGNEAHHAIVWKVVNNEVYVAECLGSTCRIHFGYFNDNAAYKTVDQLRAALLKLPGGYIQKAPTTPRDTVTPGVYAIAPKCAPNACLDVQGWNAENEANAQIWESTGADNQLFEIRPMSDGSYKFFSVYSGKALDIYRAEVRDGQNVQFYTDGGEGALNQKWWFDKTEDGYYTITSAMDDDKRLDVSCGSSENGTNVQIYTSNDSDAQKWKLTLVREAPLELSISEETVPTQLKVGANFGIRGIVTVDRGVVAQVFGYIRNENGETIQSSSYQVNSPSNNLRYSINNDLVFNKLPAGRYTYVVEATATSGDVITSATLINAPFTVS